MFPEKSIFITGVTGVLGFSLLLKALESGKQLKVLIRSTSEKTGKERLLKTAADFDLPEAEKLLNKVEVFEGDITQENLGLSGEDYNSATRNLSSVFHCAGYVDFTSELEKLFLDINVQGVENMLLFCQAAQAEFLHISTAYVQGKISGSVQEDCLEYEGAFRNCYEKSKFLGEQLVHQFCQTNNIAFSIFRPSILTGDYKSGRMLTFKNLYPFLRVLSRYSDDIEKKSPGEKGSLRLVLSPGDTLNLIPVDQAVSMIWDIAKKEATQGKTFHISHSEANNIKALCKIFEAIFPLKMELISRDAVADLKLARWERIADLVLKEYKDYLSGEAHFSAINTKSILFGENFETPKLDKAYFKKIIDYANETDWGKRLGKAESKKETFVEKTYTQKYFEDFLPTKMDQLLVENLKSLDAVFRIKLSDEASDYQVKLLQGRLVSIQAGGEDVEATYLTDGETFQKIATGLCSPQKAFFDQKVDIEGDIEKGLKTATALIEFFKSFPFVPDESIV